MTIHASAIAPDQPPVDPRKLVDHNYMPVERYNDTLAYVNTLLIDNGKSALTELPPGYPARSRCCPIANALAPLADSVSVHSSIAFLYDVDDVMIRYYNLPRNVGQFVIDFDVYACRFAK